MFKSSPVNSVGVESCTPVECPSNKFAEDHICKDCPNTKISPANSQGRGSCTSVQCPVNTYRELNGRECIGCPDEYPIAPAGSVGMSCEPLICPENEFRDGTNCIECKDFQTSNEGSIGRISCTPVVCDTHKYRDGRECKDCPFGKLCDGSENIYPCPDNGNCDNGQFLSCTTHFQKSATGCDRISCDNGLLFNHHHKTCGPCPNNATCYVDHNGFGKWNCHTRHSKIGNTCQRTSCPPGQLFNHHHKTCGPCPNNATCTGNSQFTCHNYFTKALTYGGSMGCQRTSCPSNKLFNPTTRNCDTCPPYGKCSGSNTFSCIPNYSKNSAGNCEKSSCPWGKIFEPTTKKCNKCPPNATCTGDENFYCNNYHYLTGGKCAKKQCGSSQLLHIDAKCSQCPDAKICDGTQTLKNCPPNALCQYGMLQDCNQNYTFSCDGVPGYDGSQTKCCECGLAGMDPDVITYDTRCYWYRNGLSRPYRKNFLNGWYNGYQYDPGIPPPRQDYPKS